MIDRVLIFWVILTAPLMASAPQWQLRGRLFSGWQFDDNVKESINSPRAASSWYSSGRVNVSVRHPKYFGRVKYDGAMEIYAPDISDKFIHRLQLELGAPLSRRMRLVSNQSVYLKTFAHDSLDYQLVQFAPGLLFQINRFHRIQLNVETEILQYPHIQSLDFSARRGALSSSHAFGAVTLQPRVAFEQLEFLMLQRQDEQSEIINNREESVRLALGVDWMLGPVLLKAHYGCKFITAARQDYFYRQQHLTLLLGTAFHTLHLSAMASFHRRNYETAPEDIPLFGDVENQDYNFIVLQAELPVLSRLEVKCRAGWYQNETRYLDQLYKKFLISTGVSYLF